MKLSPKAQSAMDAVIKKFESGDLSPIVEMAKINLSPDAPAAKWSFGNQILSYAQTGSLDCRGYRQWQTVGRQVQAHQRASYILGANTIKKEEDDGSERVIVTGFHAIPIFAYHQTEGEDCEVKYEPRKFPPLLDVAETMGIAVRWEPLRAALGSCTTDGSRISIGAEDSATFFHELAHACHSRLNGKLKGGQHEDQETVAEFTAAVLSEMYGQPYDGNAWKYIKMYTDNPLKAMYQALKTVKQVLELIEGAE